MHALVVTAGVSYLHFLALLPVAPFQDVHQARMLDLGVEQIPYPRLRAPKLPEPAPGPKELPKRPVESKPTEAQAGPTGPPAPARAARTFQMPPVVARKKALQTLVQLELPPTMEVQDQRVPTLVMLSSVSRRVPKPFIAPPERKNTMEVPSRVNLEMRPPILDVHPGYAKTPEVFSQTQPRLAAPVGGVAPVASNRNPDEVKPNAATVTGNVAADPANIISLPDRPLPGASAIFLPPLNQASERDSVAGTAGPMDPAGGQSVVGKFGSGEASNGSAKTGGAGGAGSGHGAGGANPAGAGAGNADFGRGAGVAGAGSGGGRTGTGGGGGEGKVGGGGSGGAGSGAAGNGASSGGGANGSLARTTPPPVRLVRPITGNYEVAVVQSSGVVPGSSGMLKGKPVFSVYVPVGGRKEWILQYCLPQDGKQHDQPSQVIELGSVAPVKAPYAYIIFGPVVQFRYGVRYGFIHGFVNKDGRFEQLKEASDSVIENLDSVLESLRQWEFRPATKDGVPAVVEVLVCIPNIA